MQLILSYFHNVKGPTYLLTSHPNLAKRVENLVLSLLDIKVEERFFEHNFFGDNEICLASIIFKVPSEWIRGRVELAMISIVVDPIQQAKSFKRLLEEFVRDVKSTENIYKAFYKDSDAEDDEITIKYDFLEERFNRLLEESKSILQEVALGNLYVLGLYAVGKTSILNRLKTFNFNPNIRPTLGVRMTRIMLENFKLHTYDVGGQVKIRDYWERLPGKPQGLIYVLDCSAEKKFMDESVELFDKIMNHYFTNDMNVPTPPVPVLILANKLDLNRNFTKEDIKRILKPERYNCNYHLGLTSALENVGIFKNFRWLISELLHSDNIKIESFKIHPNP